MSKKDKKRIAKLEQQQAILAVRLATSKANFNQLVYSDYDLYNRYRAAQGLPELSQSGFEQIKPDYIFKVGTIPSGKEQGKTEQPDPILNEETRKRCVMAGRNWGKFICFIPSLMEKDFAETEQSQPEKEQGKTEQPQQAEAQKEQELMGQLNKELAKFASIEAFNADRKNFFLPPIDKLEFDKKKAAFDYALAAAKVLRPQWYDQIDQIKIPKEGQGETEQPKPENHRENLGEPILNKPNLPKSTLNKIVLSRIEEIKKWLGEREHSTNEIAKYIQVCVDNLQLDLADFRRKVLDLGAVEQSKVEQKEAEQIETEPTETANASAGKDGWAYAILASDEKDKPRLYVSKYAVWNGNEMKPVNHAWRIETTPNKAEAFQCNNLEIARHEIENMKLHGADKGNQFGACNLRPVLICTDENAADLDKPDGSELHKSDSKDLGGADGADSPTRAGYSYIVIVNHKQGGVPLYLLDFEQTSCDGVPDMSIETTYTKQRAYKFDHIKQAQNFIDLTIECDAHKGYNFFIDTLQ